MNTNLGIIFNKEGTDDAEIRLKVILKQDDNKIRRIIQCLNGILWSTEIGKQRKIRIYESMIKSTLIYGSETWKLKEHSKRKIEATEMDILRKTAKVSRLDQV